MGPNRGFGLRRTVSIVAASLLAACAQLPAERPPPPAPAPVVAVAPPARNLTDAIASHRRAAETARQSGDLATLAVELHILTLLAPGDATYARDLSAVRATIDKETREQVIAGNAAMAAGDTERASAAMLRALALDPAQAEAQRTLREIERRRLTRIQAERAARVTLQDQLAIRNAATRAAAEPNDAFDIDQAIEMLRAGDASNGLRELRAYVDANPGNRAVRQRIGNVVAERARELEDQGAREPALAMYEQAIALRGDAGAPWAARVPALKRTLSVEYYDKGTRAYRSDLTQAIAFFEASVRYDPANAQAALKLKEAKGAKERLEKIR
jgi:tetratricopeptide (TPR) repeat protein